MYDDAFYNINESGADLPVKAGLSAPLLFLNYGSMSNNVDDNLNQ